MSAAITYRSFAKINLYLDVLERRRDGYHNIETIFQTVGLSDKLTFVQEPSRINVVCSVPGLEPAESNLVYRAATLLKERTGCPLGVRVDLEKKIPISAGLAADSPPWRNPGRLAGNLAREGSFQRRPRGEPPSLRMPLSFWRKCPHRASSRATWRAASR